MEWIENIQSESMTLLRCQMRILLNFWIHVFQDHFLLRNSTNFQSTTWIQMNVFSNVKYSTRSAERKQQLIRDFHIRYCFYPLCQVDHQYRTQANWIYSIQSKYLEEHKTAHAFYFDSLFHSIPNKLSDRSSERHRMWQEIFNLFWFTGWYQDDLIYSNLDQFTLANI